MKFITNNYTKGLFSTYKVTCTIKIDSLEGIKSIYTGVDINFR